MFPVEGHAEDVMMMMMMMDARRLSLRRDGRAPTGLNDRVTSERQTSMFHRPSFFQLPIGSALRHPSVKHGDPDARKEKVDVSITDRVFPRGLRLL